MKIPDFLSEIEGVKFDMPDAEYRKAPGVSNSMLIRMDLDGEKPGSPAHFRHQFSEEQEDEDCLFIGRAIHSRILTPDVPLEGMIAIPDEYPAPTDSSLVKTKKIAAGDMVKWNGNAKYCKEWMAQQEACGKRPMTASQLRDMDGIVNSVIDNPTCKLIFSDGKPEISLFKPYYHAGGMVLRKARVDWDPFSPQLVDLKSCMDARRDKCERTLWDRGYYKQFAYYFDLWNALHPNDQKEKFVVVFVEKFAPYALSVFDIDDDTMEHGRKAYKKNLALLIQCLKTDTWPAYNPDLNQGSNKSLKMNAPYRKLLD